MEATANNQKLGDLVEPMPGRLVVEVAMKEEMVGGIYIPYDTAKTLHEAKATQGIIVAMAEEDEDDLESPPRKLKLGDVVVFGKYSGTEITWQPDRKSAKQRVVILSEKDILARFKTPSIQSSIQVK